MIKTDEKKNCSGCRTCSLVCPKGCLSFEKDTLGAYYPRISEEECIGCGRCEKVCPMQREIDSLSIGKNAYAAYSMNKDIRKRGSSGGLFETIGSYVVQGGGSVFACAFDDSLRLKCQEATSIKGVQQLTKSKYLQSECYEAFSTIKERVNSGKIVLFCSTPCQVAALKLFLGELSERNNLILIDFFCHGIPSQDLFDRCKQYVEETKHIRVIDYEFRSKIPKGSTPHYYTLRYQKNGIEKEKTELYVKDPFYLGFQKYITLRDSCYSCPYGSGNHCGDITIGDFHNIDRYISGINRFDGVSTILINTDKGETLWNSINSTMWFKSLSIEQLYKDKEIYSGCTEEPRQRKEFIKDLEEKTITEIVDKWFNPKREWKKVLYYSMPSFVRKVIKRLVGA